MGVAVGGRDARRAAAAGRQAGSQAVRRWVPSVVRGLAGGGGAGVLVAERVRRGKSYRHGGQGGIREGWSARRARLLGGCEDEGGMVFAAPSATRHAERPADPVSRGTGHGASPGHQELQARPFLPWEHCGTAARVGRWESGCVRVGIGMRCIPACATSAASQGLTWRPRYGPGGGSWINDILVPLARALWRR